METSSGLVFVGGAFPGEEVQVRLGERRRGVARGALLRVITSAPSRQVAPCTLERLCGGCPLMALVPEAQVRHKLAWVQEAVSKAGSPDVVVALEPSPAGLGYRRRARLAFQVGPRSRVVGYRREQDHQLVDVTECPVLDPVVSAGLDTVRQRLLPSLTGSGDLQLTEGASGLPVVWLRCTTPQPPGAYSILQTLIDDGHFAGAALQVGEGVVPAQFGEPRQCTQGADGEALWGPVFGFSQSNSAVNRLLVDWVVEAAQTAGQRVVELFSGHGNFTVALARGARAYDAIEWDRAAVDACRGNLSARQIDGVRLQAGDVEGFRRPAAADVVVLDPPRTGARSAMPSISALRPSRIVYVSCDPATLARDLADLAERGYRVERAKAFDMFPQTAHVEAAVLLVRGKGPS